MRCAPLLQLRGLSQDARGRRAHPGRDPRPRERASLAFGDQGEAQRDLGMLQARADVEAAALYTAEASCLRPTSGSGTPASRTSRSRRATASRATASRSSIRSSRRATPSARSMCARATGCATACSPTSASLPWSWEARSLLLCCSRPGCSVRSPARSSRWPPRHARWSSGATTRCVPAGVPTTRSRAGDAFNSMLKEVDTRSQCARASNQSLQREILERIEAERRCGWPTVARTSSSPRSRTSCATRSRRSATRSISCRPRATTRRSRPTRAP